MYGKKDIYGGGTLITGRIPADGVEHWISLSGISWSEDDKERGRFSFYFAVPEQTAVVSVKLYVGEEWEIPDQGEEEAVDLTGKAAETMIAHSLLSLGNPYRLKRVIEKTKRGECVTLAYLGGSITQGAGACTCSHRMLRQEILRGICGEIWNRGQCTIHKSRGWRNALGAWYDTV